MFVAPGRPVLRDEISLLLRITISTYCFGMSLNEFTKAQLGSGEGGAVDGHNPGKSGWKGRVADRGLQAKDERIVVIPRGMIIAAKRDVPDA